MKHLACTFISCFHLGPWAWLMAMGLYQTLFPFLKWANLLGPRVGNLLFGWTSGDAHIICYVLRLGTSQYQIEVFSSFLFSLKKLVFFFLCKKGCLLYCKERVKMTINLTKEIWQPARVLLPLDIKFDPMIHVICVRLIWLGLEIEHRTPTFRRSQIWLVEFWLQLSAINDFTLYCILEMPPSWRGVCLNICIWIWTTNMLGLWDPSCCNKW